MRTHVQQQSRNSRRGRTFEENFLDDVEDELPNGLKLVRQWALQKWGNRRIDGMVLNRAGQPIVAIGLKRSLRERHTQDGYLRLRLLEDHPQVRWAEVTECEHRTDTVGTITTFCDRVKAINGFDLVVSTRNDALRSVLLLINSSTALGRAI